MMPVLKQILSPQNVKLTEEGEKFSDCNRPVNVLPVIFLTSLFVWFLLQGDKESS